MAESRGGRGSAARSRSESLWPAAKPSTHGKTFRFFGWSAPGTCLQAGCGLHECLRQGLSGHVQRACSVWGFDGSPTALINCLELLAVHLALNRLKRRLRGEHILVRTDNTATVAYINRQGSLRSCRMSQLARHLLLWSQKHLRSLRTIHILGFVQPGSR